MKESEALKCVCPQMSTASQKNGVNILLKVDCMGKECMLWDDWVIEDSRLKGQGDCSLRVPAPTDCRL